MAMMNCPECGKKISDGAKTCPECGWENPMLRKKEIKRYRVKGLGIVDGSGICSKCSMGTRCAITRRWICDSSIYFYDCRCSHHIFES